MGLAESIRETYQRAAKEVDKKTKDFWARHKAKAEKKLQDVASGKISMDDYKRWLSGQVFIGERWKEKLDDITRTYVEADEKAREIINRTDRNVFVRFANAQGRDIKSHIAGYSFDLYDKHTVERLLKEDPKMLPEWKINEPKDYTWNEKRVKSEIMQGIIQGEDIPSIAKRLSSGLATSNHKKMNMFARTAVTGAQNAGRMERLHEAQDMGVVVKKKWLATMDNRTRDVHRDELNGVEVDVDEPFHTSLGDIMFPGDPNADPANTYNCRCTLVYVYDVKASAANLKESSNALEQSNEQQMDEQQEIPKQESKLTVVQGKDISATWQRRSDKFDFEIEDVINAQGFDGKPRIVDADEFDKLVKQANGGKGFVAQRTYSAPNQETLDSYREMLYDGKWYVDCSTGGAQYGQGMYCAADYEGHLTAGIHEEMQHYKEINADRGNVYAYVETLTLDETAKITDYNDIYLEKINKQVTLKNNIENDFRNRFIQENELSENEGKWLRLVDKHQRTDEEKKWYNEYWDKLINGAVTENEMTAKDMIELKQYYDASLKEGIKNSNEYQSLLNMDIGSYAASKGFDAINAKGHGESGSYTVILNRTKVIFRRDK